MKRLIPLIALSFLALCPPQQANPGTQTVAGDNDDTGVLPFVELSATSSKGPLVIVTTGEGWCFVKLAGTTTAWLGPIQTSALDPLGGTQGATVGTSFCLLTVTTGPFGSHQKHVEHVTILVSDPSLSLGQATNLAHAQVMAATEHGSIVPCPEVQG
jgi:hypothetical protein